VLGFDIDWRVESITPKGDIVFWICGTEICYTLCEVVKNYDLDGRAGVMALARHKVRMGRMMETAKKEADRAVSS